MQNEWYWVTQYHSFCTQLNLSEELSILENCCLRPMMRNSVLEELRVRRLADIQEEICRKAVWRWAIPESKLRGWNEKKRWVSSAYRESDEMSVLRGVYQWHSCLQSSSLTVLHAARRVNPSRHKRMSDWFRHWPCTGAVSNWSEAGWWTILPVCIAVYLSVCLSVCLSVYVCVHS